MPIFETGRKVLAVVRTDKRLNAFIQGGVINSFSMPKELTSIAPHAFDNIRGLEEIVFTNQEDVVYVSPNAGIGASVKFVVPSQLASAYEAAYPERTIVSYESGYRWVVPYVEGETSTTLTNAYLNECLMQLSFAQRNAIRKVVVPAWFTDYDDVKSVLGVSFPNLEELEFDADFSVNPTKNFLNAIPDGLQNLTIKGTNATKPSSAFTIELNGKTFSKLAFAGTGAPFNLGFNQVNANTDYCEFCEGLTEFDSSRLFFQRTVNRVSFPSTFTAFAGYPFYYSKVDTGKTRKYIFNMDSLVALNRAGYFSEQSPTGKLYFKTSVLVSYMTATNWSSYASNMIGFLDYDGTNIPTFSGYTPTWYSDEDCTVLVTTGQFVIGTRYFVKLTAI